MTRDDQHPAPDEDEQRPLEARPVDRSDGAVDPDVDLGQPEQRDEWSRHRRTLPAIAVGGVTGACARHAIEIALPSGSAGFPWATFITNVTGCALIALLMVVVVERGAGHPLLRPLLGTGVLGGYTTFSTYVVQVGQLSTQRPALALVYLTGTVTSALVAVTVTMSIARAALPPPAHADRAPAARR